MKKVKLKKDSWHFRLATTYGRWDPYHISQQRYDICSYARKVARGVLRALIVTATIGFISGSIVDFLIYYSIFGMNSLVPPHFTGIVGCVVIGVAAVVGVLIPIAYALSLIVVSGLKWFRTFSISDAKCEPSFISAWYTSYKDKVCFPISFED